MAAFLCGASDEKGTALVAASANSRTVWARCLLNSLSNIDDPNSLI